MPVQPGDTVFVRQSLLGAITYGACTIFTHFGMGIYVTPVPLGSSKT